MGRTVLLEVADSLAVFPSLLVVQHMMKFNRIKQTGMTANIACAVSAKNWPKTFT